MLYQEGSIIEMVKYSILSSRIRPLSLFINISNRFIYTLAKCGSAWNSCAHRCVLRIHELLSMIMWTVAAAAEDDDVPVENVRFNHYYIFMEFSIFTTAIHTHIIRIYVLYSIYMRTYVNVWHSACGKTARQTQFDWISLWHIVLS